MSTITHSSGIAYVSSKDAARSVGYTSDYIARLAREGKIISRREGIQWFVELGSLQMFLKAVERSREERKAQLREERRKEREQHEATVVVVVPPVVVAPRTHTVHDVVDVSFGNEFSTVHNSLTRSSRTHALTAMSLTAGVAVAVLVTFSGQITPIAERSTASLLESFISATRFAWSFAFPWDREIAGAPAVEADTENTFGVQGIVALPPGSKDAETIQRVRESFSDDVVVRLDEDRSTGTIVPVFKDGPGDEYQFVIVPVGQSP